MGKRGPKPTPTPELKMRGSWLINNRTDEPEPESSIPTCPIWVKGEARREWFRITKRLDAIGMITELDRFMLVDYCQSWYEYSVLRQKIIDDKLIETCDTYRHIPTAIKLMDMALIRLNRAASHFGLSPACRVGLKAQPAKSKETKNYRSKLKTS